MQHSSRVGSFNNAEMQRRFGAGLAFAVDDVAGFIDNNQLISAHLAFVHTTGCHEQLHGLMLQHNAEISSGAIAPPALVDALHHFAQAVALDSAGVHSPVIPSSSIQETETSSH